MSDVMEEILGILFLAFILLFIPFLMKHSATCKDAVIIAYVSIAFVWLLKGERR